MWVVRAATRGLIVDSLSRLLRTGTSYALSIRTTVSQWRPVSRPGRHAGPGRPPADRPMPPAWSLLSRWGALRRSGGMKTCRLTVLVALTVGACVLFSGCSGDGGGKSADQLYDEGMGSLESALSGADMDQEPWNWGADVSEAHERFDDALAQNPNHCGANLMAAATRLLMVVSNPELGDILDTLFPEGPRASRASGILWYARKPDLRGLYQRFSDGGRQDFHFSQLQNYIELQVLPALTYADQRLTRFEDMNCAIWVRVGEDSLGQDVLAEVDATDAYFLHTVVDALQAGCSVAVSYNIDIDDGQTPQYLIESDADFLTLRRPAAMATAYDELLALAAHLRAACDALEAETDDQSDDVFTETDGYVPLDDMFGGGAVEEIRDIADAIEDALVSGLVFNPSGDGGPDIDVLISFDALFNDPIADLRNYFPAHSWPQPDEIAIDRPIDFPDPEFHGITPGMDNAEWELIIQWLEE